MRQRVHRLMVAICLLLGSGALSAETLHYLASYKGVLSAFQAVDIAAVELRTNQQQQPPGTTRVELTASSRPFKLVERLYPFRYRFVSIFEPQQQRSLLLERRKQTRKLRHDLALLDWSADRISRFSISEQPGEASVEMPALLGQLLQAAGEKLSHRLGELESPLSGLPQTLLDRLAMLQWIRTLSLHEGAEYQRQVTDGKSLIDYRVQVIKREPLEMAEGLRDSWQLRVDGYKDEQRDGERQLRHPPVYIWLSNDQQRLPLQFVNRHAIGRFTVRLQAAPVQVAGPAAEPDSVVAILDQ